MLGRLRASLAVRTESPVLRLLLLDWRFTFVAFIFAFLLIAGIGLPLKIWPRTSPGGAAALKVSALDLFQAWSLARTAVQAEAAGQGEQALRAWKLALANDPANTRAAEGFVRALARSRRSGDRSAALRAALRFDQVFPTTRTGLLLIEAAERAGAWEILLATADRLESQGNLPPAARPRRVKALFGLGEFTATRELLAKYGKALPEELSPYQAAVECILSGAQADCARVGTWARRPLPDREALEIYLQVCAAKSDLSGFKIGLEELKRRSSDILPFLLLEAALTRDAGRTPEAIRLLQQLPPPRDLVEFLRTSEAIVKIAPPAEALKHFAAYCPLFPEVLSGWLHYGRLSLAQESTAAVTQFLQAARLAPSSSETKLLIHAAHSALDPSRGNLARLGDLLSQCEHRSSLADVCSSVTSALQSRAPAEACRLLLGVQARHRRDPEFFMRLFVLAERARDAETMRAAAARAHELQPDNISAAANHAAMLVMFEQDPLRAVALTKLCLEADPNSVPAKVNHAAALINADLIGAADLILATIDQQELSGSARSQLHFVQWRRALKIGDHAAARTALASIRHSDLYSIQLAALK